MDITKKINVKIIIERERANASARGGGRDALLYTDCFIIMNIIHVLIQGLGASLCLWRWVGVGWGYWIPQLARDFNALYIGII